MQGYIKFLLTLGVVILVGLIALWMFATSWIYRFVLKHLALKPGMSVVDVGCGTGLLTVPLAETVGPTGKVTGIDLRSKRVRRAKERVHDAGLKNVHLTVAGVGEGTLEKAYFDRAVLLAVLGEIEEQEAALKEIFQTLKPGGILSITEVLLDPHYQSANKIRALARTTGFVEHGYAGNQFLFIMHLEKPEGN